MNVVIVIGNLTKKPELRYSTGEKATAICKFSIAVNEGFGDNKQTSFIPVTVFGKQAENCEKYLDKGSKVCIKGRIQTGSYEKDGRTVYTTDVIADNYGGVVFLNTNGESNEKAPEQTGFTALQESDIPF